MAPKFIADRVVTAMAAWPRSEQGEGIRGRRGGPSHDVMPLQQAKIMNSRSRHVAAAGIV